MRVTINYKSYRIVFQNDGQNADGFKRQHVFAVETLNEYDETKFHIGQILVDQDRKTSRIMLVDGELTQTRKHAATILLRDYFYKIKFTAAQNAKTARMQRTEVLLAKMKHDRNELAKLFAILCMAHDQQPADGEVIGMCFDNMMISKRIDKVMAIEGKHIDEIIRETAK